MAGVIKFNGDGKILTKDGKISCTCCTPCCTGLASSTSWPNVIYVDDIGTPANSGNTNKIAACTWAAAATYPAAGWELIAAGGWQALSTGSSATGYRAAGCTDGPLGNYYANTDGTGTLLYTLS